MVDVSDAQQDLERPLDGIRILEYGLFHAGPGANAILGDLGAEVIKIEAFTGDPERYWTHVAGFDLGVRPIGDWSISMTLSRCSRPSISSKARGKSLLR